jgi:hypothetical protein
VFFSRTWQRVAAQQCPLVAPKRQKGASQRVVQSGHPDAAKLRDCLACYSDAAECS